MVDEFACMLRVRKRPPSDSEGDHLAVGVKTIVLNLTFY